MLIKTLVVAGSGAVSWLSALHFKRTFGARVDVVVVAVSALPPGSAAETINPPFAALIESAGLDRQTLVQRCDATLKIASEFEDWHREGSGHRWVRTFEPAQTCSGLPLFHFWLRARHEGRTSESYQDSCTHAAALVRSGRAPFPRSGGEALTPHGYHLDLNKLVAPLRDRALAHGIRWIEGRVAGVEKGPSGRIQRLVLEDNRRVEGDFFLDCTGLRTTVMNLAYGDSTESFSAFQPCDSMVLLTHPRRSPDVRPSTLATATEGGWIWDIPLSDQTSSGYVFSSAFTTADQAEAHLRRFVGAESGGQALHARLQTGLRRTAWVQNCVCLGVSNCYLDPLDALMSDVLPAELQHLTSLFPDQDFNEILIARYNRLVRQRCLDSRDLIGLHYLTAGREDSEFWRAARYDLRRSEALSELLASYPEQAPHDVDGSYGAQVIYELFSARGILPKRLLPLSRYLDPSPALERIDAIRRINQRIPDEYPSHGECLSRFRTKV